jgi:ribonuclease-3
MGPDHDRRFTVEVRVGDTVLGKGSGKSKKAAEAEAARTALEQLSTSFTQ